MSVLCTSFSRDNDNVFLIKYNSVSIIDPRVLLIYTDLRPSACACGMSQQVVVGREKGKKIIMYIRKIRDARPRKTRWFKVVLFSSTPTTDTFFFHGSPAPYCHVDKLL